MSLQSTLLSPNTTVGQSLITYSVPISILIFLSIFTYCTIFSPGHFLSVTVSLKVHCNHPLPIIPLTLPYSLHLLVVLLVSSSCGHNWTFKEIGSRLISAQEELLFQWDMDSANTPCQTQTA